MAYKFRLQKVLDVKVKEEDNKKNEVYVLNTDLNNKKDELCELENEICKKGRKRQESCEDGASISELVELNKYMKYLQFAIKQKQEEIDNLYILIEEKKQEYMNLRKERKSYENLKDKDYAKFLEKESKEEDKMIDQIVCFANRKI